MNIKKKKLNGFWLILKNATKLLQMHIMNLIKNILLKLIIDN